jgi:hypothetical protein
VGESAGHTGLVHAVGDWVRAHFADHSSGLYVLIDSPASDPENRPRQVGGFVPDVFAGTAPSSLTLIGEAKWFGDLESRRSLLQIRAFLSYLREEPHGHFVLAVPFQLVVTARRIVQAAARDESARSVRLYILDTSGTIHRIDATS